MGEPDQIAATVAWLASGDARGVTGQAVDHNNGAWRG
jgi:NAD(P)-dependent dehydrogenase (short-subunit alcohol dehydrogenase family)